MIQLIVGLGNVGPEYERTRHNAGFWFVDRLAAQAGASWRSERGFHGEIARMQLGGRSCWLLKPDTYMNRSGLAVSALARFYKIAPESILIAHDELDLQPGEAKIKQAGGHAGHNGIKSVQAELASPQFWRLRIGIGHPGAKPLVVDYVLRKAAPEQQQAIEAAIDRALPLVPLLLQGEFERAIMLLHRKPKPVPPPAADSADHSAGPAPA
jgi:PTH1 family peptidyl-tRNA hydrolase